MKQKLILALLTVMLIGVLLALNAISYSERQRPAENEYDPDRSTYNPGPTGTEALFTLLAEKGEHPIRWQEPPAELSKASVQPSTFVVIGPLLHSMTPQESDDLLQWVASGHTLVVIDRDPAQTLLRTTANWQLFVSQQSKTPDVFNADPSDTEQMTHGVPVLHPVQPTMITSGVNSVQPSIFGRSLGFQRLGMEAREDDGLTVRQPDSAGGPVSHIGRGDGNALLLESPFGEGRIFFLGDPYIVANGGIVLADNAVLATNLTRYGGGPAAFDEFHHGFGHNDHHFFQFFEGTPVVPIFLQLALIVAVVFYSRGRRFGRPLPARSEDRKSKLEYVSAMAELQSRAKAFDLALENIYSDFRRRSARTLGLNAIVPGSRELSGPLAERAKLDRARVERTLAQIEEIIRGDKTSAREVIGLVADLRVYESLLGISRSKEPS